MEARKLPDDPYIHNRFFGIDHTHHGDIELSFWNESTDTEEAEVFNFYFAHGNETTLMAAMVGYCRRLGLPTEDIRSVFSDTATPLLEEAVVDKRPGKVQSHDLSYVSNGEGIPRFNNPVLGWRHLAGPIPSQPGIPEEVGSTSIYTREDIFNNNTLLFAFNGVKTKDKCWSDTLLRTMELYPHDIPYVAGAVAQLSMGEYRNDLREFFLDLYGHEYRF